MIRLRPRLLPPVPWSALALAAAAILVVLLAFRVRGLDDALTEARRAIRYAQPGDFVPPFAAESFTGRTYQVGQPVANQRQILFVFSASCSYCVASIPALRRLAAATDSMSTRPVELLLVTLDDSVSMNDDNPFSKLGEVVRFPSRRWATPTRRVRCRWSWC